MHDSAADIAASESGRHHAFRKQELFTERQVARFKYLDGVNQNLDVPLDELIERLDGIWSRSEEVALRDADKQYSDLQLELAQLEKDSGVSQLDGPFQQLTQNAQYQQARETMADKVNRLQNLKTYDFPILSALRRVTGNTV